MSRTTSSDDLAGAVANWIRADYEFRLGKQPYRTQTQEWLVKAEVRLRRALTGKGQLESAYKTLKDGE